MEPQGISGDLTNEHLRQLSEIVGKEWLETQLYEYRAFREKYSVPSRWWHRPPQISPIIPLVYSANPGPKLQPDNPHAVWRGDPSRILARLLTSIAEFKDYWEHIPYRHGWTNLEHALKAPIRFYGFLHELRLATHLDVRGFKVQPLFFNPEAHKGIADIVIQDGKTVYDVQCKARGPTNASSMSYDLFQYFAGRWARLVSDSGQSNYLSLKIKVPLDIGKIDDLINRIKFSLADRPGRYAQIINDWYDAKIFPVGYLKRQTSPEKLKRLHKSELGRALYSDIELIREAAPGYPPLVAFCYIYGFDKGSIADFVYSAAEGAAKADDGDNPLIISVNVYQELNMYDYLNAPSRVKEYTAWLNKFFRTYPRVPMLIFSSYWDKYIEVGAGRFRLGTLYMLVESPLWENILPDLD